MPVRTSTLLGRLERIQESYVGDAATRKLDLLRRLDRRRLKTADGVLRLHEVLCHLHAYPDDRRVLEQVERMLAGFERRSDLRRHADALSDSGVSGTTTHYPFYWTTAEWLAARWPDRLSIDWEPFEDVEALDAQLELLLPYIETLAVDEADLSTREWLELLKGPDETDAVFLIRRIARLRRSTREKEGLFDELEVPYRLAPGPGTPARTGARYRRSPVVFQTRPLDRARPDLAEECRRPPLAVRAVSPREARTLIVLAREAMVTRSRDLYAFKHADERDVRLVECGDGLQFAAIGVKPEFRLPLDSVYGFLTLKNGVPIGYVLSSSYFNSTEVAYNVFESFRGGESARIYGRVLAMMRHLFGADAFTVDPYQLGHDNDEGLESGAWWFYYKLGFRPHDASVKRLVRRELQRIRKNPRYRSSPATLNELSSVNMFWFLGRPRGDIRGLIDLGRIGLALSRYVAGRFGSDREAATRVCSAEAASLLGVRSLRDFPPGERLAWERWAPLILALPGVARWTRGERTALARVARAKGGRRESDFVRLFDRHGELRRALLQLAGQV